MRIRRHLSYANVTATLAFFLALAGGAYAVGKVRSHDIANGAVRSIDLRIDVPTIAAIAIGAR